MSKRPSSVWTTAWKIRELERARGRTFDCDLLPAEPLAQLIREAREERGMTYSEISRLTGITKQQVLAAATTRKHVTRKTDRLIRQAISDEFRATLTVPVTPYHRQIIQSLAAQGWSKPHLKDILLNNGRIEGAHAPFLVMDKSRTLVEKATVENLEWLVMVIGEKVGPSTRLIAQMRNRGVFPLKHYYANGKLNGRSLTAEQRRYVQ